MEPSIQPLDGRTISSLDDAVAVENPVLGLRICHPAHIDRKDNTSTNQKGSEIALEPTKMSLRKGSLAILWLVVADFYRLRLDGRLVGSAIRCGLLLIHRRPLRVLCAVTPAIASRSVLLVVGHGKPMPAALTDGEV